MCFDVMANRKQVIAALALPVFSVKAQASTTVCCVPWISSKRANFLTPIMLISSHTADGGRNSRPASGEWQKEGDMKITTAWLRRRRACSYQVALFEDEFGDEAEITEANLARAAELGLDLSWLALRVLPRSLWAEYRRQEAALRAEYRRQEAALRAEYRRQEAALLWTLLKDSPVGASSGGE